MSTNTGAWKGGSSPHQPVHDSSHGPSPPPNILRPMMWAPTPWTTSSTTSASALCSPPSSPCCSRQLSVANTHSCRRMPPSPIGFSTLWLGPAAKPSSDTRSGRWSSSLLCDCDGRPGHRRVDACRALAARPTSVPARWTCTRRCAVPRRPGASRPTPSRARCCSACSRTRALRRAAATARAGAWWPCRTRTRRRALRDLYQPHWRAYMELTGGAAMLADPGRARSACGCGWCSARTSSPSGSTRSRCTWSCARGSGDLAIVDAGA